MPARCSQRCGVFLLRSDEPALICTWSRAMAVCGVRCDVLCYVCLLCVVCDVSGVLARCVCSVRFV